MSIDLIRTVLWTIALSVLATASAVDLRRRIIPNEASAAVAVCGIVLGLFVRPGAVWVSLTIAFVLLVLLGLFTRFRLIGGGDAKMIPAVSLLVPPEAVGSLLLAIALAGGILSLVYVVLRRALGTKAPAQPGPSRLHGPAFFARFARAEGARIRASRGLPYALAILAGLTAYVLSELPQCSSETHCLL
jgi:prepilin peptidase CpaA